MSDLIGKLNRELVEEKEGKLSTSQTKLRESHLASFQAASLQADMIKHLRAFERLGNPSCLERLSLQHSCLERFAKAHLHKVQRIRASKRRTDAHVATARLAQDPEYNQFPSYEARDMLSSPTTSSSAHCTLC